MNSNVIPNSYRVQNGCFNCKFSFALVEYDVENEYFCMINCTNRPISGSCLLNESFCDVLIMTEWTNWAKTHAVADSGICDKWKDKKELEICH